eukprot:366450-Chlamydomonas_euryale.AAC.20
MVRGLRAASWGGRAGRGRPSCPSRAWNVFELKTRVETDVGFEPGPEPTSSFNTQRPSRSAQHRKRQARDGARCLRQEMRLLASC